MCVCVYWGGMSSMSTTWEGTVVCCPVDDRSGGSLGVAGQGQTLTGVKGHVTRQLLEGGPHVDGQADILSDGARRVGGYTSEHTSIS